MSSILAIGLIMLAGVASGRAAVSFGVSSAVGYLFAGLAVGQVLPGVASALTPLGMGFACDIGLALIAFVVGGELESERVRTLPRGVMRIAIIQAVTCVALVTGVTVLLGRPLELGLVLGSIAAATAPASTIMIVRRTGARGPLTSTLLSVVAIDDVVCIVIYAIAAAGARAIPDWTLSQSAAGVVGVFLWEVLGAILVGAVIGIALGYFVRCARGGDELVVITVGAIFLTAGIAGRMHASPLISCLVLGATISNLVVGSRKLFASVDSFSPPIYVLVFSLAGVAFSFGELRSGMILFAAYTVMRAAGKIVGAGFAAALSGAESSVSRFIGISLLPQAGLAAGLVVAAGVALPDYRVLLASIVIPGVFLFELVGLQLAERCLVQAGEAKEGR